MFKNNQRAKSTLANTILEMFCAMARGVQELHGVTITKAPLLLVGKYAGGTATIEFLSKQFTVVLINEYYTSQRCSRCHNWLNMQRDRGGTRQHLCSNPLCYRVTDRVTGQQRPARVNKDVNASQLFLSIFLHVLETGRRPYDFCSKQHLLRWYPAPAQAAGRRARA
jgi:hypothetical protein